MNRGESVTGGELMELQQSAPLLWFELRKWLQSTCNEINRYSRSDTLDFELGGAEEVRVLRGIHVRNRREWTRCFDGRVSHDAFDYGTREETTGNAIRISVSRGKNRKKANVCLIRFRCVPSQVVGGFTTFQLVFRTLLRFVLTNCMS
jgi:hypothetical protein